MNELMYKAYFGGGCNFAAKRQGKSIIVELLLNYHIFKTIGSNVPSEPYKLLVPSKVELEEITWLPTGEVISRRI